jgi:protease-4
MGFLRTVWRFLIGVKDALALVFLLLFFGVLAVALVWRGPKITVPQDAALVIDLEGVLVDQASELSAIEALAGPSPLAETEARDVVDAITRAKDDPRISAIFLDLDGFAGGGLANLEEVGRALQQFRAARKPVYAYATAYADDGYFLAAHASEAWVNPLGGVFIAGPGGNGLYFKDALDRLKVDVEVFRVGTFKSAVEPFTRSDASPEARAADQALADDLWAAYAAGVARARPGLDLPAVINSWPQRIAGLNGDLAALAISSGLVDKAGTRVAMLAALRDKVGPGEDEERPGDFNGIDLVDYLGATDGETPRGPVVGIIHVAGTIIDGEAPAGQAGGTTIADLIDDATADGDVKAIVLRIDSPGGSATASDVIREAAMAARASGKPVVASMGPVAASGGYWVATAAEWIAAEPTTVTGSIGVFGVIPTFGRTLAELGVKSDGVATTPYSGQPDIVGRLNDPARGIIQASVVDIYRRFIAIVAESRRLEPAAVEAMAEGRVWSGTAALRLRLVDAHGGLDAAVAEAARRAKMEGKVESLVIRPEAPLLDQILRDLVAVRATGPQGHQALVAQSRLKLGAALGAAQTVLGGPAIQVACMGCAGFRPAQKAVAQGDWTTLAARLLP